MIPDYFIYFALGIFIRSLLYITKIYKVEPKKLWFILCLPFISLLGMLPFKSEHEYNFYLHIFFSICMYAGIFGWYYRREILTTINELVLLQLCIIIYYCIFSQIGINSFSIFLGIIMLIPLGFLIDITIRKAEVGGASLYILYMLLNIFLLSVFAFSKNVFTDFLILNPNGSHLDFFLLGFNLFYLIVNIVFIYELIPFKDSSQTYPERFEEIHQFMNLLAMKYKDDGMRPLHLLLAVALQGCILLLNLIFNFLPSTVMISFSIVMIQVILWFFAKEAQLMAMSVKSPPANQPQPQK